MTEHTVSRDTAITRFSTGPDRLAAAVEFLADEELDLSLAPGEWSIRQIIHHLADGNDIWATGLKRAIASPGSLLRFEGYPGNDAWSNAMHYSKRAVRPALALFDAHIHMMEQLVTEFPAAWENTLQLADEQGRVISTITVGALIDMLSNHLDEHLVAIQAIKQQHGLDDTAVNPAQTLHRLIGANMDIDLATPKGMITWAQAKCPWNEEEQTDVHHCAVKNTSICLYFGGVQPLDTVLCSYRHGAPTGSGGSSLRG